MFFNPYYSRFSSNADAGVSSLANICHYYKEFAGEADGYPSTPSRAPR
ncbi:MAG TPA: hypothetical protein VFC69_07050 [Dysgonamonadaceae bacterium]|nr:hypothetical protein [Dysgonamonadaceae bacterium]